MTIRPTLDEFSIAEELLTQAEATYGYLPRMSVQRSDETFSNADEASTALDSGASWGDRQPIAG